MAIGPIELHGMITRQNDVQQVKVNQEQKPLIDHMNQQVEVEKKVENNSVTNDQQEEQKVEISMGNWNNNVYTNDFLGLKFNLPEGWTYSSDEEIAEMMNLGIEEARNYPVAPGNSVTFKDETSPYVYTKTQGFSQLDRPVFEKYRLVKEEDAPDVQPNVHEQYALQSDLELIRKEIAELRKSMNEGESNE